MDHDVVVLQKTTERYLLGELDPDARHEFEEHFFDCPDCALDVRAGALFVEQSKVVLAEKSEPVSAGSPVTAAIPAKPIKCHLRGFITPSRQQASIAAMDENRCVSRVAGEVN